VLAEKAGAGGFCAAGTVGDASVEAEGVSIDELAEGAGDLVLRMLLKLAL